MVCPSRELTFFMDENLAPSITTGMRGFGENVVHLLEWFDRGTDDVDWLPVVGEKDWVVITRDAMILRRIREKEVVARNRVGVFVLDGKKPDRCRLIQQIVLNWPQIKATARQSKRPFGYKVPLVGTRLKKVL